MTIESEDLAVIGKDFNPITPLENDSLKIPDNIPVKTIKNFIESMNSARKDYVKLEAIDDVDASTVRAKIEVLDAISADLKEIIVGVS